MEVSIIQFSYDVMWCDGLSDWLTSNRRSGIDTVHWERRQKSEEKSKNVRETRQKNSI